MSHRETSFKEVDTVGALGERLNRLCDEQPYHIGWHLKDLRTGDTANRDGDVVVAAASTRKIAIMMAMLRAVSRGRFTLEQPVPINPEFQKGRFVGSVLAYVTPGCVLALKDFIALMIIVSDNVATGTIVDMLGLNEVNELCHSIGMRGTAHRWGTPPDYDAAERDLSPGGTNATTPNDQGLLLDLILKGVKDPGAAARLGCTSALCERAIDILSGQVVRTMLPSLLPEGTRVAHKTGISVKRYPRFGALGDGYSDVGIVFEQDHPLFILAVYTYGVPQELRDGIPGFAGAYRLIGTLCRTCWDELGGS